MKFAILGGTFNPIHFGHLLIAKNALESAQMDKVVFVPCFLPPHKQGTGLVSSQHRLKMIELAIKEMPQVEVSTLEIARGGKSYTVDTIRTIRHEHPDDELFVIVGSDIFLDIGKWRDFSQLIGLCEFLVIERPGVPLTVPTKSISKTDMTRLRYQVLKGPTMDVSSSQVRESFSKGKNVSHLIPAPVYEYIHQFGLYKKTS